MYTIQLHGLFAFEGNDSEFTGLPFRTNMKMAKGPFKVILVILSVGPTYIHIYVYIYIYMSFLANLWRLLPRLLLKTWTFRVPWVRVFAYPVGLTERSLLPVTPLVWRSSCRLGLAVVGFWAEWAFQSTCTSIGLMAYGVWLVAGSEVECCLTRNIRDEQACSFSTGSSIQAQCGLQRNSAIVP